MGGTAGSRCSQQGPGGQGALGGQCDWNRQCGELWGGRAGQVWMAGRGRVRRGQGLSGPAPPASLETAQSTQSLGDGRLKIPRRSAQGHTHTHGGPSSPGRRPPHICPSGPCRARGAGQRFAHPLVWQGGWRLQKPPPALRPLAGESGKSTASAPCRASRDRRRLQARAAGDGPTRDAEAAVTGTEVGQLGSTLPPPLRGRASEVRNRGSAEETHATRGGPEEAQIS